MVPVDCVIVANCMIVAKRGGEGGGGEGG
jgi:hypothetical protein